MNTLGQCKSSGRIRRISGLCSDSADWLDLFNDAVRMLMNRGDFYGTVQKICSAVYDGCITWPREVLMPLAINMCNHNIQLANHWYHFDYLTRNDLMSYWHSGCAGGVRGVDGEMSPVFNPISCADGSSGVYLHFYPSDPSDIGKVITVFGIDSNGNELRSTYPDGTMQDGVQVALNVPYVALATVPTAPRNVPTIRHVTRVIKEVTNGPVYVYQYDAVANLLRDLAVYQASETLPSYRTTRLPNFCGCQSGPQKISALVKIQFIAAVNDNDLIGVDNIDAIAMMMQALKLGDAYDPEQKRKMEAEAVRELNLELRTRLPLDQIPVEIAPFGTAVPSRHAISRFT